MRHAVAAFAVVLSTLVVPVAITATWLSLRVDDTEAYVDAVAPLADEPALRDVLAREVADAASAAIAERVPGAGAFDPTIRTMTRQVVENDAFPEFWREANAKAHQEFLAIVHERDDDSRVADGWVYLDIGPLLDEVLADLVEVLPVAVELPSRPVLVPVVPESELERGRGAYQVLDFLAVWAPLLWLALVALAVLVTPGVRGRLRTGALCGLGAALGGFLVMLLEAPVADLVVDQAEPDDRDLVRLIVEVVTASLGDTAVAVVVGGLVVGGGLLVASLLPGLRGRSARPARTSGHP